MKNIFKKINFWEVLLFILLFFVIFFIIYFPFDLFQKKAVSKINSQVSSEIKTLEQCKIIFAFDYNKNSKNKYFERQKFLKSLQVCRQDYDFEKIPLNKENCQIIISETNDFFVKNFINISDLDTKKLYCISEFYSDLNFLAIPNLKNNEFKLILTNFSDFYSSIRNISKNNENYEKYQDEAKKLLTNIFDFGNLKIKNIELLQDGKIEFIVDLEGKTEAFINFFSKKFILKKFEKNIEIVSKNYEILQKFKYNKILEKKENLEENIDEKIFFEANLVGNKVEITGQIKEENFNNNYIFIVKRISDEKIFLENIFFINDKNFTLQGEKLAYSTYLLKSGNYVFEYGKLNKILLAKYFDKNIENLTISQMQEIFDKFETNQDIILNYWQEMENNTKIEKKLFPFSLDDLILNNQFFEVSI